MPAPQQCQRLAPNQVTLDFLEMKFLKNPTDKLCEGL